MGHLNWKGECVSDESPFERAGEYSLRQDLIRLRVKLLPSVIEVPINRDEVGGCEGLVNWFRRARKLISLMLEPLNSPELALGVKPFYLP